jgi:hypothetical protein
VDVSVKLDHLLGIVTVIRLNAVSALFCVVLYIRTSFPERGLLYKYQVQSIAGGAT